MGRRQEKRPSRVSDRALESPGLPVRLMVIPTINTVSSRFSQTFLLADAFWLRKITMDPHIFAHVNRVIGLQVYKIKCLCFRTEYTNTHTHTHTHTHIYIYIYIYIYIWIRNSALLALTVTKVIVARFLGTGGFLIYVFKLPQKFFSYYKNFLEFF